MIRFLTLLILIVGSINIFTQEKESNMNSLISTEYAFTSKAAEVGTRDAFLKFIADDGILFRPNPVNGKKFLSDSKPSSGLLFWYPAYAEISDSGDMGFTTGPWEWRREKNDSSAIAFGNYCTVWQMQKEGKWKFVIDIGNRNDKPETQPSSLIVENSILSSPSYSKKIVDKNDELFELDKQFTECSAKEGSDRTYQKFVNKKSRLLRNGSFPIIGFEQISDYITTQLIDCKFNPMDGKMSLSEDFGFTYGELEITKMVDQSNERYYYMRIWKKENMRWYVLVEIANIIKE